MRTIKFKAKRIDNGEWVDGDLINSYEATHIVESEYFKPSNDESPTLTEVDPATVCQFTGLTDKNGKEIWEGDKVGYYQPYAKRFEQGFVKWDDLWACFAVYKSIGDEYAHENDWVKIQEIEVTGSIHDKAE